MILSIFMVENLHFRLKGLYYISKQNFKQKNGSMKIREVKISNLMSFPYVDNMDDFDGIDFEKIENSLDMNILIGANGQ